MLQALTVLSNSNYQRNLLLLRLYVKSYFYICFFIQNASNDGCQKTKYHERQIYNIVILVKNVRAYKLSYTKNF